MNVLASELFTSYGQVSSDIQPIRDVIKGHSFLSMFKDGLIDEQLIVVVMIASEIRGTTGEVKLKVSSVGENTHQHRPFATVE